MLSLILSIVLLFSVQSHKEPYAWSGIVPGTHNRQAIEKRFGAANLVTSFGESEYSEVEINRGGQDRYIPAKTILVGYDRKGVVVHLRVRPVSHEYDLEWLELMFGRPDCWVTNTERVKLAGIYHARRIVALMGPDSKVEELFLSASQTAP